MSKYINMLVLAGVVALAATPARAQLTFTFTQASQNYAPGDTATWNATFQNTGLGTITFDGISFSGLPAELTVDDTAFFNNFGAGAVILLPGNSSTADVFTTTAGPTLPFNTYNVTATVDYTDTLLGALTVDQSFSSVIMPEPGSLSLLCLGMGGAVMLRRRRA